MRLENGQRHPELEAESVEGDTWRLPADLDDGWSAVLFYRGHW